jgi:methionine salvage enolase-phosphatase E1
MTNEEIKSHFGSNNVYLYSGTSVELQELMFAAGVSHNVLVANYGQVYFVCPSDPCPADEKITEIQ